MHELAVGPSRVLAGLLALLCAATLAQAGWDYSQNGANWDDEGVCKRPEVTDQSPINLPESAEVDATESVFFKYPLLGGPVSLLNDGHTLAITMPETYKGGFALASSAETMLDSEAIFRLWQIHFHSPSEHTIQGKHMGLEMQLVHKDIYSHKVAVYSVMFAENGESSMFLGLLQEFGLPKRPWEEVTINRAASPPMSDPSTGDQGNAHVKDIDLRSLINGSSVYRYTGGMTEPPCEPGVEYFVRQHPAGATQDQLTAIQTLLQDLNPPKGNNRMVQPLGTRTLKMVPAMDAYDPKFVPVDLGAAGVPEKKELPDTAVVDNPEFRVINADDSDALKEAKTAVQVEKQNAEGARVGALAAKGALTAVEELYAAAPGYVEKIELKWTIIDKTNAYNGAVVASENAEKKYQKAISDAKKTIEAEIARTGKDPTQPATTTPAPQETTTTTTTTTTTLEGATTTPAPATAFPPEPTIIPGWKLGYFSRVKLPRGDAGNPFLKTVAENQPRIGNAPGLLPFGPDNMHIKENLRQRQGPLVPVPQLVRVTTTPTPTTTLPPTIKSEIYVDPGNITNETQFKSDLVKAIAKSTGVDEDQVQITNITEHIITPPPTPLVNATNGTNGTNATNATNGTATSLLFAQVGHPDSQGRFWAATAEYEVRGPRPSVHTRRSGGLRRLLRGGPRHEEARRLQLL